MSLGYIHSFYLILCLQNHRASWTGPIRSCCLAKGIGNVSRNQRVKHVSTQGGKSPQEILTTSITLKEVIFYSTHTTRFQHVFLAGTEGASPSASPSMALSLALRSSVLGKPCQLFTLPKPLHEFLSYSL